MSIRRRPAAPPALSLQDAVRTARKMQVDELTKHFEKATITSTDDALDLLKEQLEALDKEFGEKAVARAARVIASRLECQQSEISQFLTGFHSEVRPVAAGDVVDDPNTRLVLDISWPTLDCLRVPAVRQLINIDANGQVLSTQHVLKKVPVTQDVYNTLAVILACASATGAIRIAEVGVTLDDVLAVSDHGDDDDFGFDDDDNGLNLSSLIQ